MKHAQLIHSITGTPRLALKWLLRFINDPLDHAPKNWTTRQQELAAFTGNYPEFQQGACVFAVKARAAYHATREDSHPTLPSPDEANTFRTLALEYFDEFTHSPRAFPTIEEPNFPVALSLKSFGKADPHNFLTLWVRSKKEQFRINVFFTLAQFGHNIKNCESCSKYFLAKRTDQIFCCDKCSALVRQRHKRGTPPERFFKLGRPPGTTKAGLAKGTPSAKRRKP